MAKLVWKGSFEYCNNFEDMIAGIARVIMIGANRGSGQFLKIEQQKGIDALDQEIWLPVDDIYTRDAILTKVCLTFAIGIDESKNV